MYPFSRGGNL